MNFFLKNMIVAGSMALMIALGWAYTQADQQPKTPPRDQVTGTVDINGTTAPTKDQPVIRVDRNTDVPVEQVQYRRYYRYPYGYGWRSYYREPYYYGGYYYGTPGAGYYDYGYGRGAVRVGPVQVWW